MRRRRRARSAAETFFGAHVGLPRIGRDLHVANDAAGDVLYELIGMARPFAVGEWEKYYRLVDRTFPRFNTTPELPFAEGQ